MWGTAYGFGMTDVQREKTRFTAILPAVGNARSGCMTAGPCGYRGLKISNRYFIPGAF